MTPQRKIELLAPAGDWDMMRSAVANGADAVYFGLQDFNARRRAQNFQLDDLPQTMDFLHGHNVRGYVTFNTLIFSEELPRAVEFLRGIAAAGADAIIVQDLGLAALAQKLCPTLPVHASTQMTQTHPQGLRRVESLGVRRVILARELSIDQIRKVAAHTKLELEVFVHGALCVSYSGQCLASECLLGRSANRGQCAQACRLPYQLVVDGRPQGPGERYLLSPQDLCAYDRIGELIAAGATSFKIEGRLKGACYVAAVTQVYRSAIDAALANPSGKAYRPSPQQMQQLEQSFSRGHSHGFLEDAKNHSLVAGDVPDARGVAAGKIVGVYGQALLLTRVGDAPMLKPGDGVVVDCINGGPDQGGRVYLAQERDHHSYMVRLGPGDLDMDKVFKGSIVYKTDDPQIRKQLESSFSRDIVVRPTPIRARVTAIEGSPLAIEMSDEAGNGVKVQGDQPLEAARKYPLTVELLQDQLGRLGQSPFALADIELLGAAGPASQVQVMAPKSTLNDLRRQAVEQLIELRRQKSRHSAAEGDVLASLRAELLPAMRTAGAAGESRPRLMTLVRNLDQLEAVLSPQAIAKPSMVYVELNDPAEFAQAAASAASAGVKLGIATPRIIRPGEEAAIDAILTAAPQAILVRNLAALELLHAGGSGAELIGDHGLNAANELTAGLLAKWGLSRIVPSYDLSWRELEAMLAQAGPDRVEIALHQHVPMFHMQHCPSAAKNADAPQAPCRRGCRANVQLQDRNGERHAVLTDALCRTTVYNSFAQSAAEIYPSMRGAGLEMFRVEFVDEPAAMAQAAWNIYGELVGGALDGVAAWEQLKGLYEGRLTRGTWEERRRPTPAS